jgi:transposase
MKTVAGITGTLRRQHDRAFKAELVKQCLVPGASVAAVALAGGINANLLFKWRSNHLRSKRPSGAAASSAVLVPVQVAPGADADAGDSRPLALSPVSTPTAVLTPGAALSSCIIELDVAGALLRLRGPVDEASLRSVLRALRHGT